MKHNRAYLEDQVIEASKDFEVMLLETEEDYEAFNKFATLKARELV